MGDSRGLFPGWFKAQHTKNPVSFYTLALRHVLPVDSAGAQGNEKAKPSLKKQKYSTVKCIKIQSGFICYFVSCFLKRPRRWLGVPALRVGALAAGLLSPQPQDRHSGTRLGSRRPRPLRGGQKAGEAGPRVNRGPQVSSLQHTLHCPIRLHSQNTNSKKTLFGVLRLRPQNIKPQARRGPFPAAARATRP